MKPKIYLIILCGAGDRPIAALEGKTPLDAASTDCLDYLAQRGVQGLLTIIDDEICPESDSGTMSLLGYEPLRYYTGRGALEAVGLGFMGIGDNAVGFRINFASYNESKGVLDRRTARDLTLDEQQQLVDELRAGIFLREFPDVEFSITGFGRHRGVVCFKSSTTPLNADVSNTDPGFRKVGAFGTPIEKFKPKPQLCEPLVDSSSAATTATLVNGFIEEASQILNASEVNAKRRASGALSANILLFRDGGGQVPSLQTFSEKYGLSLSLYGQIPAEHGLCKLIGGRWNDARIREGESEEEYYGRLVFAMLQDPADVICVHVKGPDEPGHDGLAHAKVRAIEDFDRWFMRRFLENGGDAHTYIVTSDHATPCELKIHSADRVATLISSPKLKPDATQSFCEREAAHGDLAVGRAPELLSHIVHRLSGE